MCDVCVWHVWCVFLYGYIFGVCLLCVCVTVCVLQAEVREMTDTAFAKLAFLDVTSDSLSPLQISLIQLQVRTFFSIG